jgi:peptidyl-prolyl cis-trans isomerase A (cyclophilin A)|tara:strand:+ start:275 stop:973 length:699 start_codon:yes stop_codon:yes gene_type:complete
MRILIIFLVFLSLYCCQGKKTRMITNDVNTSIVKSIKNDSIIVSKEADFVVTDKNVMEFLVDYGKKNTENTLRIITDYGSIDILLFKNTKFHRANFVYLAKKKYFNNTQFYRVISNFVIQGGNSDDRITLKKRQAIGKYLLPNDYDKGYKHDRGMLSMPSKNIENPYKKASPFEFFIVQQKGGAHHLDGDYTVFGKVIKGMEIVDRIAAVPTDASDWPLQNVFIKDISIIKQ